MHTFEVNKKATPDTNLKDSKPDVSINMLSVLNNLLDTHYIIAYPHLMAKHCLTVSRKSRSEA